MPKTPCAPTNSSIETITLDCGATLLVEPNESVQSTSLVWWMPSGTANDPLGEGNDGTAAMIAAMLERGAGELDSRAFNDALDSLGALRDVSVEPACTRLGASVRSTQLDAALELFSTMVLQPRFPEDGLEPVRSLALQAISSLRDDPSTLASINLGRIACPQPYNRSSYGNKAVIESMTLDSIRDTWAARNGPVGSIISIAGGVDPKAIAETLNRLLENFDSPAAQLPEHTKPIGGTHHTEQSGAQVYIELGLDAPAAGDPDELPFLVAVRALGGGCSSRLFESVREKRGLCYDVHASYASARHFGLCVIGAGTTPERVGETVTCIDEELAKFEEGGLTGEEFDRIICGLKTRTMMQGESTSARALAMTLDFFRRGAPRTLGQMAQEIEQLTHEQVQQTIRTRMGGDWRHTMARVSVGPCSPFSD